MAGLSVYTLYSGSKGNSIYLRVGDTELIIDAGLTCGALKSALGQVGSAPERLDAVFVTHEHSDHVSALNVFSKRYAVPIHMTEQSASEIKCSPAFVVRHDPLYSVTLADCEVSSFVTPHDSRMSVGYIIRTDYGNVGIATDLGYVSEDIIETLSFCNSVVLESNHDIEMLRRGPYPPSLKQRIMSRFGHLSNKSCADAAAYLASCGVKNIMLAHLSEHNNTPELAYLQTRQMLDRTGYSFVNLRVAARDTVTDLIRE